MAIYLLQNSQMPTTASPTKVATGTTIKTMLQVKAGATAAFEIIEWGVSFDGSAVMMPGQVELIETDVAATVTAFTANDITKYDTAALVNGNPTTALIEVGTSASGYTATSEGSITSVRTLAGAQLMMGTNQFIQQFPLGTYPVVQAGKFARIRVTMPVSVNAYCYMIIKF